MGAIERRVKKVVFLTKQNYMNYELAKKLRDAGFPQDTVWYYLNDGAVLATKDLPQINFSESYIGLGAKSGAWWIEGFNDEYAEVIESFVSAPTLSELIEICGKQFKHLHLHQERFKPSKGQWSAKGRLPSGKYIIVWGHEPEEAVANLYLELNQTKLKEVL